MTLFWHQTGPKISYHDYLLHVSDLNPHVETKWYMSRWEIFAMGWRCIWAALKPLPSSE